MKWRSTLGKRYRIVETAWELFKTSLFIIGGGYSILIAADQTFSRKGLVREGELMDHLGIFQMIPGLIATHTAVYVGRKAGGWLGAAVGVFATALPSIVIFTLVACGYKTLPLEHPIVLAAFTGLKASLTGIILATIIRNWRKALPDFFAYALMIAAAFSITVTKAVALTLVAAMAAGLLAVATCREAGKLKFNSSLLPLLVFLKYGSLCFGGGFVLVPMYLNDFVGAAAPYLNIAADEFADIMALSQMTPGPIGVNCATFFGYRLAGVGGAVVASALLLLPGSVLAYLAISSLERFSGSVIVRGIMRGVRPASIALMLVALAAFARLSCVAGAGALEWAGIMLVIASAALTLSKRISVVLTILLSASVGILNWCVGIMI